MEDGHPKPAVRKSRTWLVRGFAAVALCAAVVVGWKTYSAFQRGGDAAAESRTEGEEGRPPTDDSEPPPTDVAERKSLDQRILGTWQDNYQGKRTMHLKSDGTGTMLVELEGWNATLFASRLTFEMVWSIEGNRLTKRTIGGEPEGRVKAVLAMMGDEVEEEIIELTDERLLVKEVESEKQFDWRRAPE